MFCVSLPGFPSQITQRLLVGCGLVALLMLAAVAANAQRQKIQDEDQPLFAEFKGVRIGMAAEEARKKLGSPRDKGDDQDFYLVNDNEAVQVFYDKAKTVSAISIDFMGDATAAPAPRQVVGGEPDAKPDGSVYKMVRYSKAGFWVSYSKTAGNSPTITITMQKIEH